MIVERILDKLHNIPDFMIKRLLHFCFLLATTSCFGQQPTQYSLYMLNQFQYNPAYAGMNDAIELTADYRKQWQGLNESPTYQNINVHLPIYRISSGLGIDFENDRLGLEQNLKATLSYNFHLPLGRSSLLGLGFGAGIFQKKITGESIRTPEGIYNNGAIEHNDNLPLPNADATAATPTFNAGLYFKSELFEIGISTINLQEPVIKDDFLSTTLSRNYFLVGTYNLDLVRNVSLHPSVLIKTDQTEWQSEISLLFKYDDNIFLGGSFRGYNSTTVDAASLLLGGSINDKITLAYAYDFTLSELNIVSSGSHELLLKFNLGTEVGKGKLPKIIFNPRYLD